MRTTQVLRLLLRHWLVIGLITLAVGAGAFAVSATRTPQYTATSSSYLTVAAGQTAVNLAQGSNYLRDQMDSFGELARSPRVLNAVIDDLRLNVTADDLGDSVAAVVPRNTVVLRISASSPDPRTAASVSNAITAEFAEQLNIVGPRGTDGAPLLAAQTIQSALPPRVQTSPNTRVNTLLGLLIGAALGCAAVWVASRLDDKLRTPERIATLGLGDLLGSLRHVTSLAEQELVVVRSPAEELATDFRQLSAALEAATKNGPVALAVTSAERAEGRTVVAANLAAALAERGNRVVLVDADLRHARLADLTGASGPGLLQVLAAADPASAAIAASRRPSKLDFAVIPAGGSHDNPTAVLAGDAMAAALASLRAGHDFVIIDTAPLLPVADTIALGKHVPDLLVVGHAQQTSRTQLTAAVHTAQAAGLGPVGIVLNQVRKGDLPAGRGYLASQPQPATPRHLAEN